MKYILLVMVLLSSAAGNLYAQTNKTDQTFSVPENFSFGRSFYVDLGGGNKMQVQVSDVNDLVRVQHIDSILAIFLQDFSAIKDSITNEEASTRVDQFTNAEGIRKIRFLQFPPKSASFIRHGAEMASLKIEQDTINIIGVVNNPPKAMEHYVSRYDARYYKLTFYLNNLEDLLKYMGGLLEQKVIQYQDHRNEKWVNKWGKRSGWGPYYLNGDASIYVDQKKGVTGGPGDFLSFQITVNAQNYKNYFVPSFGLGTTMILSNREKMWKHEISLQWEPNFLFAKNTEGKLSTFRNDFLTLSYGQAPVKDKDARKQTNYTAIVSLGYLIYRKGEYYDKNTLRLGAGRFQIQKTAIEPGMYFHDLFRNVTPTIRIIQSL